jgi:hypothetical protein
VDIRDAMAEAILRDVLANPGKYHYAVVKAARFNEEIWCEEPEERKGTNSWHRFVRAIEEHGLSAQTADSPEEQPEDNGKQNPDARDFQE